VSTDPGRRRYDKPVKRRRIIPAPFGVLLRFTYCKNIAVRFHGLIYFEAR
jgi:hypothetical protein